MDLSLRLIACDRGAAAILNGPNQPAAQAGRVLCLPDELTDLLSRRALMDVTPLKTGLRIGSCEYICRVYLLEGDGSRLTQSIVAIHLEKNLSASDAASEVGARYNLTERELEALEGILMGLGSKEVAERMNISPNTVKAFLRLIMIKMGVATRAGIVAKVLQNRGAIEENDGPSGNNSRHLELREVAASAVAVGSSPKASGPPSHRLIGEAS